MSQDVVYHGLRARQEIHAMVKAATPEAHSSHRSLARMHYLRMKQFVADAIDQLEVRYVEATFDFWEDRLATGSGRTPIRKVQSPILQLVAGIVGDHSLGLAPKVLAAEHPRMQQAMIDEAVLAVVG